MSDPDAPASFDARLAKNLNAAAKTDPLRMKPVQDGLIPNTLLAISTISLLLGGLFSLSFVTFCRGGYDGFWWSTYQLSFFAATWSLFHWGEFAVTAGWNREKCTVDSFLLDNGNLYHIANATALTEYLLTLYFKPAWKTYPYVSLIGIVTVVLGQTLRTMAMIHASTNFSHAVAFRKADSHQLVTDGVYRWFRHPSYAGFFYWGLGTQLVLQNPLSFTLYCALMWRFFYYRIRAEEGALLRFFGDDYAKYRSRVGTKIPFIP